jgi:hypothetical protein
LLELREREGTTQVPQLDTAEQTAEQYYFELLSQLGETRGRPTGHEFLACRSKIAAVLKIRNCSMQGTNQRRRRGCGAPPQMRSSICYNSKNAGRTR